MSSSTNSVTNPTLSIARFVMMQMNCLKTTENVVMASVHEITPFCVHWETAVSIVM